MGLRSGWVGGWVGGQWAGGGLGGWAGFVVMLDAGVGQAQL